MKGEHSASSPQLTEYAELHGCSCKVGQADLTELLAEAGLDEPSADLLFGVGEDAGARQLGPDLALVQTVDFFTPIIDDPYEFGRVAACNAVSDAFATGATDQLSCLVVMGIPRELTDVAADILAGMADSLATVDGAIAGGHTTLNPWPFAGGAITATAHPDDLLTTTTAEPGDRLYLTKPLGTQPAMGALRVGEEFADEIRSVVERPIGDIGAEALSWMTTPNRAAAEAGRDIARAATDVTGYGLLGQARVLAKNAGVGIEIDTLPVIEGTPELSRLFGYGLEDGESAETSGGLLFAVDPDQCEAFEDALASTGVFYEPVGRVTTGNDARLDEPQIEKVWR